MARKTSKFVFVVAVAVIVVGVWLASRTGLLGESLHGVASNRLGNIFNQ